MSLMSSLFEVILTIVQREGGRKTEAERERRQKEGGRERGDRKREVEREETERGR
jgi:hypothetical protein